MSLLQKYYNGKIGGRSKVSHISHSITYIEKYEIEFAGTQKVACLGGRDRTRMTGDDQTFEEIMVSLRHGTGA